MVNIIAVIRVKSYKRYGYKKHVNFNFFFLTKESINLQHFPVLI